MRIRLVSPVFALAFALAASVANGASRPDDLRFVPASRALRAACHATANAVGYPVPCPLSVPAGLAPVGGRPGCSVSIIGAGRQCPNTLGCWCGWVIGSGQVAAQNLVLSASPHVLPRYARVVNGPAWYAGARTRPLGWITVAGRRMRTVWVPARTNDASSFSDHLALIWSERGHTYAVGFLNVDGLAATLALDRTLAAGSSSSGRERCQQMRLRLPRATSYRNPPTSRFVR